MAIFKKVEKEPVDFKATEEGKKEELRQPDVVKYEKPMVWTFVLQVDDSNAMRVKNNVETELTEFGYAHKILSSELKPL